MSSSLISSYFSLCLFFMAMLLSGCESRPFFAGFFDPTAFSNGTSLIEDFFLSHLGHTIGSFGDFADLTETLFGLGK